MSHILHPSTDSIAELSRNYQLFQLVDDETMFRRTTLSKTIIYKFYQFRTIEANVSAYNS